MADFAGYWDFFSGSCVAPEDVVPLGEELLLLDGLLLVDGLVVEGLVLAPPEAVPEPGLAGSVVLEELDELEPGVAVDPVGAGVLEAPPDGDELDEELEPLLEGGVDGVVALLLELPVVPVVPVVVRLSSPQAARPKAIATAIAIVESFMVSSPWLG